MEEKHDGSGSLSMVPTKVVLLLQNLRMVLDMIRSERRDEVIRVIITLSHVDLDVHFGVTYTFYCCH